LPPVARLRLRPLRSPLHSRLLHLLAHPRRRFLRVRRGGRVPQRRPARRGGPGPVQARRRLRRVLPGALQGRGALRRRRREGRRHGPREDQGERHGPRAQQPGVRRHGPPRHGRAARQARRRRRRVQEVGASSSWRSLTRDHGPAWSTSLAPPGPLQLRAVVTGGYDGKWVWADREVLPRQWRAGEVYDTGVQTTDIAQEACFPCDTQEWR
uniref:Expansin-like CBD domain-containing protein n=1 Tax=Aegilops tauschii subsp. strangulata TaxID=200361 RepID=A0A453J2N9_AEGTS